MNSLLHAPWDRLWWGIPLLALLGSCSEGISPDVAAPKDVSIQVIANPTNVLAAEVDVRANGGTEAWVEYTSSSGTVLNTPAFPLSSGSTAIDVLGLKQETSYEFRVFIKAGNGSSFASQPFSFTTQALPSDIPKFSIATSFNPSPGYVMIGISPSQPSQKTYAFITDNDGNVVWYRKCVAAVADFQKQPNGNYTVYSSLDGGPSRFYELDRGGRIHREITADDPANTDAHELRIVSDNAYLFGLEFRIVDLTSIGGVAGAVVRGIRIERHQGGQSLFQWSTLDHFQVSDAASDIVVTGSQVNPWHGNAMEIDSDGTILASFRNADVIAKIDGTTGAVLWRLGGRNNEFTFVNDPLGGFSHQHGIRRLPNGHIIMFDNGNLHVPPLSRAVEYDLNESAKTATLVWEYRGSPELYSLAVGNAQRLRNGNTLICFGIAQHVLEVDPSGAKQWELVIDEPNHYPYRAFRIDSLY